MSDNEFKINMAVTFKAMKSGKYGCIIETTPKMYSPYIGVGDNSTEAMDKALDDFWKISSK